ncbi:type III secretion system stator protein SctL [Billgrantia sp. Q4P2]|uniref:type III secretion system stator protein SctL n=1 Tax=Billgrantia sp. Q4P2 TaxID=3463857 RepID=UPI004055DDBB
MFVKRRVALPGVEEVALAPLIKAERLGLCLAVEQVLGRADERAAALVADAEEQAKRLLDEAQQRGEVLTEQARMEVERQVWQQADALLDGLRQAEQGLWEDVERHAEQVLRSALVTLLGEVAPQQRVRALLRQLVDAQRQLSSATLYCAPEQQACVEDVLGSEHLGRWRVLPGPRLEVDQLVLETDSGVFRCSWSALSDALSFDIHDEPDDGEGTQGR